MTDGVRSRPAPTIDLTPEEFRRLGHRLVDRVADLLASLPDRKVTTAPEPQAIRDALPAGDRLAEAGCPAGEVLDEACEQLFARSLFNGHPRFMGYITSSAAPLGVLGELLAGAANANVGAWKLSPVASEIEAQTVRWIADLVGFPTTAGGLLVSGGNLANIVAFLAARTERLGPDIRRTGVGDAPRLCVYGSAETHTWIQKAADLSGLGTDALRWVRTDAHQRLDVAALRAAIGEDRAAGRRPFLVVGSAGTVSTGAVDDLPAIAQLCRDERLWFHVDGAYGAFATGVPGASPALAGIGEADSVAVDPHKWLYAPLEAGCVLVRRPADLTNAFSYHPPYYHFEEGERNYVDYGLQNSRGFRALKVWLTLRQVGRRGYRDLVAQDCRLAERLFQRVEAHPAFEAFTRELSIATFRYRPADLRSGEARQDVESYLDALNRSLLEAIERSGELFLSNAVVNGRFALRACIVNFRTTDADVDAVPEIVARIGATLDARERPPGLPSE